MYVRVKRVGPKEGPREYLQIVESFRDGKTIRQRVITTLGRLDHLRAEGAIDGLMRSLSRFSEQLRIIEASRLPDVNACRTKLWGPPLVFGKLWERQGLPQVMSRLAQSRSFGFDVERAAFALALQRLVRPGSDLQGSLWLREVEAEGFERIELRHLYRCVGFLNKAHHELERELFMKDRDLFSQCLDLVFIDTTSTYGYCNKPSALRRRGLSRDKRPELPQMVIAVAVDAQGWPIAWEALPGNTMDAQAFGWIIEALRKRFQIRRVIIVADRGMMSQKNLELLTNDTEAPFQFIMGCRMRQLKEVDEEVLARAGSYQLVSESLKVKEVLVEGRRYIVCLNEEERLRDAAARQAILAQLEEKLHGQGAKSLIGNRGYARFLKAQRGAVQINPQAVERDARYDGKFVLLTDTSLPTEEVARAYKNLWRVERSFREEKSTLEIRPIFHHNDGQCVGHIAGSFLALRLEMDLQRALDEKKIDVSWPTLMHDLSKLEAVHITLDGKRYIIRTDFVGSAYAAFQAAGVQAPPRVTELLTGNEM
jgi:DNA-binding transcriptional ArsR family regulator